MDPRPNFVTNVTGNVLATAIVLVITSSGGWLIARSTGASVLYVVAAAIVVGALISAVWVVGRRVTIVARGREQAMRANLRLLMSARPGQEILSTRMTYWAPVEVSRARQGFRQQLTKLITEDRNEVKRVWQVRDRQEFDRMMGFLEKGDKDSRPYREYENYYLRCYVGSLSFIPDLLIVGRKASVSISAFQTPRCISVAYHFRWRRDVKQWRELFYVIFNHAHPIFMNGVVDEDGIEKVRKALNALEASGLQVPETEPPGGIEELKPRRHSLCRRFWGGA